jgi:hypothetical protein
MSLINDALKKAQHQRTGDPGGLPPMPGSRSAGSGSGSSIPPKTLALIIAGAVGIVVVSVVITIVIVNRKPAPHVAVVRPAAAKPAADDHAAEPSPVAVAPIAVSPRTEVAAAKPIVAEPARIPVAETTKPAAAPVVAGPPPLPAPAPAPEPVRHLATGTQDIRILTMLDALRVTGIRASGAESKVLMNDRVYRINDMVDYTLGIRLTKVAAEGLTFVDANGTTYVKNF